MSDSVLVFGSSCVDVVIRVDHLPRHEEDLNPDTQQFMLGGCACNVARILGRGGADLTFVTPVGLQGVYGPWVLAQLKDFTWAHPVCLETEANGCCYCLVEPDGERTFMSVHGAEYTFAPEWMEAYQNQQYALGYVCGLELEEATGQALADWLKTAPVRTLMYAPGPRGLNVPPERTLKLLALHPLLHLNRAETLQMAHCSDLTSAMETLSAKTRNAVITTLGADGAMLLEPGYAPRHIPGTPATCITDTIGAGDAHAGAVLLGLSRRQSLPEAVVFANRVASRIVAQVGADLKDTAILFPDPPEK